MTAIIAQSPVLRGCLWMVGALLSFLTMAVAARQLSYHMGTFEILFFRSAAGILIMLPLIMRYGIPVLRTQRPMLQFGRNIVHFVGQYCWTVGIALLPLAQVFALEFTMPIWATIMAILFLGERATFPRMVAIAGGFFGVLVVLRPGFGVFDPAALVVLTAAAAYAVAIVVTKVLTRTDSPLAIIFYMTVMQLPMALIPALFDWVPPVWADVPWIFLIGGAALSAHYTLARALTIADASIVLPIDFLRVPLVALVGYLFYAEAIDAWVFAGAAVIFFANYYAVRKETRAASVPSA